MRPFQVGRVLSPLVSRRLTRGIYFSDNGNGPQGPMGEMGGWGVRWGGGGGGLGGGWRWAASFGHTDPRQQLVNSACNPSLSRYTVYCIVYIAQLLWPPTSEVPILYSCSPSGLLYTVAKLSESKDNFKLCTLRYLQCISLPTWAYLL